MNSQKIGECLKRNMEKNNITAEILSEKTGLSLSRIEEYMSGEFVPKAFELKLIAHEVGDIIGVSDEIPEGFVLIKEVMIDMFMWSTLISTEEIRNYGDN